MPKRRTPRLCVEGVVHSLRSAGLRPVEFGMQSCRWLGRYKVRGGAARPVDVSETTTPVAGFPSAPAPARMLPIATRAPAHRLLPRRGPTAASTTPRPAPRTPRPVPSRSRPCRAMEGRAGAWQGPGPVAQSQVGWAKLVQCRICPFRYPQVGLVGGVTGQAGRRGHPGRRRGDRPVAPTRHWTSDTAPGPVAQSQVGWAKLVQCRICPFRYPQVGLVGGVAGQAGRRGHPGHRPPQGRPAGRPYPTLDE